MLFTEFDINRAKKVWQEEAMEIGEKRGEKRGKNRGKKEVAIEVAQNYSKEACRLNKYQIFWNFQLKKSKNYKNNS